MITDTGIAPTRCITSPMFHTDSGGLIHCYHPKAVHAEWLRRAEEQQRWWRKVSKEDSK